jgi:SpoVK/Ycf46/Vps4 family AAA+-type ATPase
MGSDPLLSSLRAAVAAAPDDIALRVHLAELLAASGANSEAVREAAFVLRRDPGNAQALRVISSHDAGDGPAPGALRPPHDAPAGADELTLRELEAELAGISTPRFPESDPAQRDPFDAELAGLRFSDVAGMAGVKAALEAAFLAPLRSPELARAYGKSLRGGLLLYGPPGCGKTFLARALAGELGARFVSVSLADVLDMYIGQSERNLREIFHTARRSAPCLIFLDEVDALGQKRSQLRSSVLRGTVNQLLAEMDGVESDNAGVYVLGATNHPWDVDVALRRPGRFDRMLLVLPPDEAAREAILRYHLRERPIARIDAGKLARMSDGYSGADLAYACESAAELALLEAARDGVVRMIETKDLVRAVKDVKPSIGPWLQTARNVAQFANEDGSYDELLGYLRKRRLA